jgi:tRNA U55 pseudouridine synthase TruB
MARRRKANFFADGFLLINKPEGPTSHDVVARLGAGSSLLK